MASTYGHPYVYPVYGTPDDMLFLDIGSVAPNRRSGPVPARVEGRKVVPVLDARAAQQAPYTVELGNAQADIRDRKVRLRAEGKRIVPYYTRVEIERNGLGQAPVLVWVENPVAFYSMQIQGSGKVKLPNGKILRLAYAEQNGHPFEPTVAAARSGKPYAIRTRGVSGELIEEDTTGDAEETAEIGDEPILTRGFRLSRNAPATDAPTDKPGPSGQTLPPEVEEVIAALMKGNSPAPAARQRESQREHSTTASASKSKAAQPGAPTQKNLPAIGDAGHATSAPSASPLPDIPGKRAGAAWPPAISSDPSYIFFREIPDSEEGPIGALGIPLTAGRSLAVDPRTTPLGFPVFVATAQPGKKGNLNRLMLAQDTGGAVRGAVRADYFWGFGTSAGAQASRMKETGQMWLLLPKGQPIAAREQALRMRSLGAKDAAGNQVECLVADPDLCIEDAQ